MSDALERAAEGEATSTGLMRAAVYDDYGDAGVLHLSDHPTPQRRSGGVKIRVHACSVNPIDYRLRRGEMKRLLPGGFPRIPGFDVAGVIEESDVDGEFRTGDRVMAFLDHLRGGACAEYAVCSAGCVARLPESMRFEEAAAIPLAGSTALQSLRDHGRMQQGQRVLINGASGGVGMYAVQIAKASQCFVTAVASAANEEFCRSLGADEFLDYAVSDFTNSNHRWDLVFDAAGKSNYFDARKVLSAHGRFVSTEPNLAGIMVSLLTWPLNKSGRVMLAKPKADDLRQLIALQENDQLSVTIDRQFSLEETADAHRRVESGVDRGKVIIRLDST